MTAWTALQININRLTCWHKTQTHSSEVATVWFRAAFSNHEDESFEDEVFTVSEEMFELRTVCSTTESCWIRPLEIFLPVSGTHTKHRRDIFPERNCPVPRAEWLTFTTVPTLIVASNLITFATSHRQGAYPAVGTFFRNVSATMHNRFLCCSSRAVPQDMLWYILCLSNVRNRGEKLFDELWRAQMR